ncbi:MAG: tetratricopeptide repeat protein [Promethearchaeota archaeon]
MPERPLKDKETGMCTLLTSLLFSSPLKFLTSFIHSLKWASKEVVADNLRELGTILSKQKKYQETLKTFEKALAIYTSKKFVLSNTH